MRPRRGEPGVARRLGRRDPPGVWPHQPRRCVDLHGDAAIALTRSRRAPRRSLLPVGPAASRSVAMPPACRLDAWRTLRRCLGQWVAHAPSRSSQAACLAGRVVPARCVRSGGSRTWPRGCFARCCEGRWCAGACRGSGRTITAPTGTGCRRYTCDSEGSATHIIL